MNNVVIDREWWQEEHLKEYIKKKQQIVEGVVTNPYIGKVIMDDGYFSKALAVAYLLSKYKQLLHPDDFATCSTLVSV